MNTENKKNCSAILKIFEKKWFLSKNSHSGAHNLYYPLLKFDFGDIYHILKHWYIKHISGIKPILDTLKSLQ